ncbi:MAG: baseplate J/gp47 family protein [Nitrosomonadaceae bacterium]
MALDLPDNADEVVQRSKTDVQRDLPGSDPFLDNSWLGALVTAFANRIFDFYIQLQQAINLNFPDTTTGEFLDRWASIYGVPRTAATQSSGNIVATGTVSTPIPISTGYQSSNGLSYATTAAATITSQSLSVTSIVRVGSIATVTTTVDHNIASNVAVTISGSDQTEYNGVQVITVTATDQFIFTVIGTPVTPATGTILAGFVAASVPVQSVDFETVGQTVNQSLDAPLTLGSPIAGVDNTANVDFGTLGGGVAQESDTDLRNRLLSRIQNPVAHFSVADIENQARLIAGVTRVFVQSITPAIGQVTIYFMRDNDSNPIPDTSEVATVKAKILEINPANTAEVDVIVSAPTPISTAFTFTSITPDTITMENAITATLGQFFDESTVVGEDVDEDKYRSAIISTIDTETGDQLATFTLSTPSGDISISVGQIATLGVVTF